MNDDDDPPPVGNPLARHPGINARCYAVLVDWMHALCTRRPTQTFHLAVQLLARSLACTRGVTTVDLQLVGITAFFVADKYEDSSAPHASYCARMCAGAYKPKQILHLERRMLQALEFRLTQRTTLQLLARLQSTSTDTWSDDDQQLAHKLLLVAARSASMLARRPIAVARAVQTIVDVDARHTHWPTNDARDDCDTYFELLDLARERSVIDVRTVDTR